MRRTVIALLLLMSGAATAVAQPAKQNPLAQAPQKGHCAVGVLSHLGEKFRVEDQQRPFEKVSEVSVESWHLDDLVVDKIRGALGKQAAVQRIPYSKEASAVIETLDHQYAHGALFRLFRYSDDVASFRDAIRTLASSTRCARYVLVTKAILNTDDSYRKGIGIRKGLFGISMAAVIAVRVFNGDAKVLSTRRADYTRYGPGIFGAAHPERVLDASFWPDPPTSAAQNAKLREATRELIARCLDTALPKPLP